MRAVYKYPFYGRTMTANIPSSARVVHFAEQRGVATMWAEADLSHNVVERCFFIVGTGENVPHAASYCATMIAGEFVWHLYELLK